MQEPAGILSPDCFASAAQWEVEKLITEWQRDNHNPGTGTSGRLFVPASVHSQVLQWAHSNKIACHPGINQTLSLLKE